MGQHESSIHKAKRRNVLTSNLNGIQCICSNLLFNVHYDVDHILRLECSDMTTQSMIECQFGLQKYQGVVFAYPGEICEERKVYIVCDGGQHCEMQILNMTNSPNTFWEQLRGCRGTCEKPIVLGDNSLGPSMVASCKPISLRFEGTFSKDELALPRIPVIPICISCPLATNFSNKRLTYVGIN